MRKSALLALAVALLFACSPKEKDDDTARVLEDVPFQGPGWSDTEGITMPQGTDYVVSVTYLRVNDTPESIAVRDKLVFPILDHLHTRNDHIGHMLDIDGDEGWTYTVWVDEAARYDFVYYSQHLDGLPELNPHVADAKFVHFDAPGADIPHDWSDAKSRLP